MQVKGKYSGYSLTKHAEKVKFCSDNRGFIKYKKQFSVKLQEIVCLGDLKTVTKIGMCR